MEASTIAIKPSYNKTTANTPTTAEALELGDL